MPRIRTLKPAVWSDLAICSLPRDARATLRGLLNYCDDEGRGVEEMRLLKAFIWPLDDDITLAVLGAHLDAIEAAELIVRYQVDGVKYLAVSGWKDTAHPLGQTISHAYASDIPAPPSPPTLERSRNGSGKVRERSIGKGREGKGREGKGKVTSGNDKTVSSGDEERRAQDAAAVVVVGSADYERLRTAMRPEDQPALAGYTRGAKNPAALVRMLAGIPDGLYGTVFDLETVGRALTQMAGNGDPLNGRLLAGYCRSILEGPPPPRRAERADAEDAGVERSKRWAAQKDAERQRAREPAHAR